MAEVALEGMRGLAVLDPALVVTRDGSMISLGNGTATLTQVPAPAGNDPEKWAQTIALLAQGARTASPEVAKATDEQILEAVFDASLAKLDQFSRYSGQKEARDHRASRNGFGGIGVRYEPVPDGIKITEVTPEGPAAKAGMAEGDVIQEVNGEPVAGLEHAAISAKLRGAIASEVVLTVRKTDARMARLSLRRALVVPPTVKMAMKDGIAEIKVTGFNQRTASSLKKEVTQALQQGGPGFRGIVLDLRGNPGGLLDQAVSMADLFMAQGPIVSTRGRHPSSNQSYDAAPGDIAEHVPLVVLVDGKSASASEILSAALQDSGRAVVIGTNSYGKGTVQTVIRMPNDGEMTLTWSRFHSPTGYALHGLGVMPTICTADEKANPLQLVQAAMADTQPVAHHLAVWRATHFEESDVRSQLRTACPSAKHGDLALDMDTARDLLNNRALYQKALAASTPPSGNPERASLVIH